MSSADVEGNYRKACSEGFGVVPRHAVMVGSDAASTPLQ